MKNKFILAIETSCDETAMSLVRFVENKNGWEIDILSNVVASQIDIHKKWGGVYPELASRAHLEAMIPVLEEALEPLNELRITNNELRMGLESIHNSPFKILDSISAVAVTQGPGLIGSLLMGIETAQVISAIYNKPIVPVNHLEGHVYSAFAEYKGKGQRVKVKNSKFEIPKRGIFPVLSLVVSGGHTSLILMEDHLKYKTVGQTIDDAAGEAFDKVARILDLGYPGGPAIEKLAKTGNENVYDLPVALKNSLDFSFSGLKTAALYLTKDPRTQKKLKYNRADLAASFQKAVVDALILKTQKAISKYNPKTVILSGGVSANGYLRERFVRQLSARRAEPSGRRPQPPVILIPPVALSTDNAVGIAIASALKFSKNQTIPWKDIDALPNFPIDF
ncbi:MAG: tRNA (adenosine(37)-N6)-threonylcarbamoyltransferase complex transferase subunit TsaD [Candidatus Berkelbacteria bacterium]|nr:tRNA (adenosine(37)-N6)-threonylcarbamoyltransferase complex transferase subunit TsaD [Candidatus Berkelbacteria bacterium]